MLIRHDAEIYRYHVGFPEYAMLTTRTLRIFAKGSKVSRSELFMDLVLVTNVALLGEAYQGGDLTLLQSKLFRVSVVP